MPPSSSLPSLLDLGLLVPLLLHLFLLCVHHRSKFVGQLTTPASGLSVCGVPPFSLCSQPIEPADTGRSGIIRLPCPGGLALRIPSYITAATSPILGGETESKQASNPLQHRTALAHRIPTPPPTFGPASSTPDLTSTTRPATRTRSTRIAPRPRGRPVIHAGQPLSSVLCHIPYLLRRSAHTRLPCSSPLLLLRLPPPPPQRYYTTSQGRETRPPGDLTYPTLPWSGIWPFLT